MVDSSGNRSLRGFKNIGQEFFGEVMPQVEKGNFQCCVEGEFSGSGV